MLNFSPKIRLGMLINVVPIKKHVAENESKNCNISFAIGK